MKGRLFSISFPGWRDALINTSHEWRQVSGWSGLSVQLNVKWDETQPAPSGSHFPYLGHLVWYTNQKSCHKSCSGILFLRVIFMYLSTAICRHLYKYYSEVKTVSHDLTPSPLSIHQVKAAHDAHLALTSAGEETDPMLEIFIGAWEGAASAVRFKKCELWRRMTRSLQNISPVWRVLLTRF